METENLTGHQKTRKSNIIAFLVDQEKPANLEELLELTAEWEKRSYQVVREAYRYCKQKLEQEHEAGRKQ